MENTLQNTSANSYGQNIDSGANQSQQPSIMPEDIAKLARGWLRDDNKRVHTDNWSFSKDVYIKV